MPELLEETRLECSECGATFTLREALDRCDSSFPSMDWAYFDCTTCGRSWVLEVSPGRVAFGEFEEFPPSPYSFIPIQEIPLPAFELVSPSLSNPGRGDELVVRYGNLEWKIPE
jgi:hypothetical protein